MNFRPAGSTRQDIMVIYVEGETFKNNRTSGVTYRFPGQSGPRIATVFVASRARVRHQVLAHEFGHALLYDPVNDCRTDPTPGLDRSGHVPASNKNNLMLPSVTLSPTINAGQCRAAARSPLITSLIQKPASNQIRNRPKKRI